MVKTIKLICIAGILALLVLIVLFTGNGRSSTKYDLNNKSVKEQNNENPKRHQKKSQISKQNKVENFNLGFVIKY